MRWVGGRFKTDMRWVGGRFKTEDRRHTHTHTHLPIHTHTHTHTLRVADEVGGREVQDRRLADPCCCMAETSTIL